MSTGALWRMHEAAYCIASFKTKISAKKFAYDLIYTGTKSVLLEKMSLLEGQSIPLQKMSPVTKHNSMFCYIIQVKSRDSLSNMWRLFAPVRPPYCFSTTSRVLLCKTSSQTSLVQPLALATREFTRRYTLVCCLPLRKPSSP